MMLGETKICVAHKPTCPNYEPIDLTARLAWQAELAKEKGK